MAAVPASYGDGLGAGIRLGQINEHHREERTNNNANGQHGNDELYLAASEKGVTSHRSLT